MTNRKAQSSSRAGANLALAIGLSWCVAMLSACDDGGAPAREDSGDPSTSSEGDADDAEAEAEDTGAPEQDGAQSEEDGGVHLDGAVPDADSVPLPGTPCETAEDCDDGLYCNGQETCDLGPGGDAKVCMPGAPPGCTREHPCWEEFDTCDCRNPDADNDNDGAEICLGNPLQLKILDSYRDCDDGDPRRCTNNAEECDTQDLDEDCDAETFGERDQDGDGYYDANCRNWDEHGNPHGGDDCDDHDPDFHPRALEICDYFDNNCNGYVDERRLPGSLEYEQKDGGLRELLLPDRDRDGHGESGVEPTLLCNVTERQGLVVATASRDCDDTNPHTYEGAPEICDGFDNDCDGKIDADDVKDEDSDGLQTKYSFPGTKVSCVGGVWKILEGDCPTKDVQWCEERDPIEQGCRTDATRLSSCRECQTDCKFSCGDEGCDEVSGVAAGSHHTCAVTKQKRVACWGRGAQGQLGNENLATFPVAMLVSPLPPASSVSVGQFHSCAIVGDERAAYCWGDDTSGQLGSDQAIRTTGFSWTPLQVSGGSLLFDPITFESPEFLTDVVSLSLGAAHTCAVLATGELGCWGQQEFGRLGNNALDAATKTIPAVAMDQQRIGIRNAVEVSVGDAHSCVRTRAGGVACGGDNRMGQLGRDPLTMANSGLMLPIAALHDVTALSAGAFYTCVIAGGEVFCWGENQRLQLGRAASSAEPDYMPKQIPGLSGSTALACGNQHCCALSAAGRVACWGANDSGQLGKPPSADSGAPNVVPLQDVTSIAAGNGFSCAITASNIASCWGDGRYGKLGIGSQDARPQPTPTPIRSLLGSRP